MPPTPVSVTSRLLCSAWSTVAARDLARRKLVNSAVAGPPLARRRRPTWSVAAGAGGRRQRGVLVVVKLERGGECRTVTGRGLTPSAALQVGDTARTQIASLGPAPAA